MTRYVYREGLGVIEADRAPPRYASAAVRSDFAAFKSPLDGPDGTHKVIDGRAALREELKRNECRLVERGESNRKPGYINPHFAMKRGLPLNG